MKYTAALVLALLASPLAAEAQQQTGRVARIGYLSPGSEGGTQPFRAIFVKTLGDLGWTEGRNLTIERRYAGDGFDRLPALLAELISRKVDVIVAASSPTAVAAKKATGDIPIVFNVTDPLVRGWWPVSPDQAATSLAWRPSAGDDAQVARAAEGDGARSQPDRGRLESGEPRKAP